SEASCGCFCEKVLLLKEEHVHLFKNRRRGAGGREPNAQRKPL
ncbi:hypothetical protein HMPREF3036_01035, partial [Sutterella sp. KLE1602]